MKRLHVHVAVTDIAESVRFYSCCYARSEKSWIDDPQGVKWETFLTVGESTTYGSGSTPAGEAACCEPPGTPQKTSRQCCPPA